MRKLLMFVTLAALLSVTACYEEAEVTKSEVQTKAGAQLLVNNSTIFRLDEPSFIWTTSLNQLQVLTGFRTIGATIITLNGRLATFEELKKGDVVCIFYTNDTGCDPGLICRTAHRIVATRPVTPPPPAPVIKVNNSTIFRLDEPSFVWTTSLNQLQVLTGFRTIGATIITLNGRRATFEELRSGDIVCIFYTDDTGCDPGLICRTAHRIIATRRPA